MLTILKHDFFIVSTVKQEITPLRQNARQRPKGGLVLFKKHPRGLV